MSALPSSAFSTWLSSNLRILCGQRRDATYSQCDSSRLRRRAMVKAQRRGSTWVNARVSGSLDGTEK